jgi:hypothetical protein
VNKRNYLVHKDVTLVCFAGLSNICDDMQFMLGKRPEIYWRVTWAFFAPVILSVIILIVL